MFFAPEHESRLFVAFLALFVRKDWHHFVCLNMIHGARGVRRDKQLVSMSAFASNVSCFSLRSTDLGLCKVLYADMRVIELLIRPLIFCKCEFKRWLTVTGDYFIFDVML